MPSVMSFPTRIVHGRGAIRELPAELKRAGAGKLLLVTDKGILQAGLLRFVTPLLEQSGVPFTVFSEFDPNPTDSDALKGIEAYRAAGADAILSVGGGASLDMGKAIRLLVHHGPPLSRYDDAQGGDRYITGEQPPFVAVPTTAGTGSEVGRSTVLIIDGTKVVIFSPHLLANAALLDPELTIGLPPGWTRSPTTSRRTWRRATIRSPTRSRWTGCAASRNTSAGRSRTARTWKPASRCSWAARWAPSPSRRGWERATRSRTRSRRWRARTTGWRTRSCFPPSSSSTGRQPRSGWRPRPSPSARIPGWECRNGRTPARSWWTICAAPAASRASCPRPASRGK